MPSVLTANAYPPVKLITMELRETSILVYIGGRNGQKGPQRYFDGPLLCTSRNQTRTSKQTTVRVYIRFRCEKDRLSYTTDPEKHWTWKKFRLLNGDLMGICVTLNYHLNLNRIWTNSEPDCDYCGQIQETAAHFPCLCLCHRQPSFSKYSRN